MKNLFLFFVGVFLFSSCAGVKFYSDAALTEETGIPFYNSKPFLLVEKDYEKDKALKATIVYLPDTAKPSYAKLKEDLEGQNSICNLKMECSNLLG